MRYLLAVIAAYLLGSMSFSIFLSKALLGRDVRSCGSGNAGATNMARVYGMRMGALTLAGDMLKGAAAMFIGWKLCGDMGLALGGTACMLGHCFPVFHSFRGGKGVSVGAVVALAVDWRVFIAVIAVFALTAVLSKKVSLGSICAALAAFIAALIFAASLPRLALTFFSAAMIIVRHRENIRRLLAGTEPDFKTGSKGAKLPKGGEMAK